MSRGSGIIIHSEMLTGPSLQWHQAAQVIIILVTSSLPLLYAEQASSCSGDRFVFLVKEFSFLIQTRFADSWEVEVGGRKTVIIRVS